LPARGVASQKGARGAPGTGGEAPPARARGGASPPGRGGARGGGGGDAGDGVRERRATRRRRPRAGRWGAAARAGGDPRGGAARGHARGLRGGGRRGAHDPPPPPPPPSSSPPLLIPSSASPTPRATCPWPAFGRRPCPYPAAAVPMRAASRAKPSFLLSRSRKPWEGKDGPRLGRSRRHRQCRPGDVSPRAASSRPARPVLEFFCLWRRTCTRSCGWYDARVSPGNISSDLNPPAPPSIPVTSEIVLLLGPHFHSAGPDGA